MFIYETYYLKHIRVHIGDDDTFYVVLQKVRSPGRYMAHNPIFAGVKIDT